MNLIIFYMFGSFDAEFNYVSIVASIDENTVIHITDMNILIRDI